MIVDANVDVRAFRTTLDPLQRVVFTNGCFDILHVGHVALLEQAKALGDVLVVGVNSDASVQRLKGLSRPVNDQRSRARVLAALRCVDHVIVFDEDTPFGCIEALQPDILVKGGDYSRDTVVGADAVEARGGSVVIIPLVSGYSTSSIIAKAQQT